MSETAEWWTPGEAGPRETRRDLRHGTDPLHRGVTVAFDGFKALDDLSLYDRAKASCAASSAPTEPGRRR